MKKILLLAATGCMIFALYQASPYKQEEQSAVQLIKPQVMSIQDTTTLHGTVEDPDRQRLYATGTSRVLKVYVKPGDTVKKGQVLIELELYHDPEYEQATAAAAFAQLKDTLESGDVAGAESMLESLMEGEFPTDTPNDEAKVYQLYSPSSGMVMSVSAKEGDQISSLLPCLEICDLKNLIINVTAGEEVVGYLKESMNCLVSVPAFSLAEMPGRIDTIMPYAKQTGLFTGDSAAETSVHIKLNGSTASLRPGYRATAKIIVSQRDRALLVPYEAVEQTVDGSEYVLKLVNGRAVKQIVVTGAELDDQIEITQGVTEEDLLLLTPTEIEEGVRINLASVGSSDTVR